jgi:hypothetical protein
VTTRTERCNSLEPTPEPDRRHRCSRPLRLGGVTYRCSRTIGHSGAHDAFTRHTDGALVRW